MKRRRIYAEFDCKQVGRLSQPKLYNVFDLLPDEIGMPHSVEWANDHVVWYIFSFFRTCGSFELGGCIWSLCQLAVVCRRFNRIIANPGFLKAVIPRAPSVAHLTMAEAFVLSQAMRPWRIMERLDYLQSLFPGTSIRTQTVVLKGFRILGANTAAINFAFKRLHRIWN